MSIAFVTGCLPPERQTLVAAAVAATRYLIFGTFPIWPNGETRSIRGPSTEPPGVDLAVRSYPLLAQ